MALLSYIIFIWAVLHTTLAQSSASMVYLTCYFTTQFVNNFCYDLLILISEFKHKFIFSIL